MGRLPDQLAAVEHAATVLAKTAPVVTQAAKRVAKHAAAGELVGLRRALEQLRSVIVSVQAEASTTQEAWPYTRDQEETYLSESFEADLVDAATAAGFRVTRHEGELIVFPFVVRISGRDRSVLVDGKRSTSLLPAKIVATLVGLRARLKPSANEKFLEALHAAYLLALGPAGGGQPVALSRIYDALTLLPGAASTYSETEFVRDIYLLDRNGPHSTKNGATFSLPASTGTRNRKGVFSFVGPEGERVEYFAIQFADRVDDFFTAP